MNRILKDRRLQRDDICETECIGVNTKQRFSVEPALNDKGGEDTMINERKYTPFDGKENDWLLFAKQQAEFYRNAGQYITNLQIDIKEIDDEIEDILLETEDANHCVDKIVFYADTTEEIVKLNFESIRMLVDYCEQLSLEGKPAMERWLTSPRLTELKAVKKD